jgi:GntR family transcriptional regulator/MocR family aminotransferase
VVADPERVVVVSGVAQAMTLLGFMLHARGVRTLGVEDPGSPEHGTLYASAGIGTVPLPLDDEGLATGPLRESGVRGVVTTPAHQFPSGIAYSARRRTELLDWARSVDGLVIEDDYDGDFRYDRAPVGALQGLDPEHVAYTGSVSKSLAPGLRLGWLLVPASMAEEVVERKRTMDLGHPVIDQALLARFVERGDYDRQLRRCQRAYKERRDTLVTALEDHFPGAEVSGIAAGLHVIAALPDRYGPPHRFLERTAEAGVAVRPLTDYAQALAEDEDGDEDEVVRLVLGYAHVSPARIREGVRLMAEAARSG